MAKKLPEGEVGLLGTVRFDKQKNDRADVARMLSHSTKRLTLDAFVRHFTSEMQSALDYYQLLEGGRTCQRMSLLYNPHRLLVTTSKNRRSMYDAISDPRIMDGFARYLLSYMEGKSHKSTPVPMRTLLNTLEVGVNGLQYANEFPPHVARDLCKRYGLDRASKVLDPCAGWGGRMIGVSTVCDTYVGYEPATLTHKGLTSLAKTLAEFSPGFKGRVFCKPFEDAKLPYSYFDLALTSPPYFDTERYSDEETQSYIRYPTYKVWLKGFFFPLIDKTIDALKPGAPFVLNIGSRTYKLNDAMREHCKKRGYIVSRLGRFLSGAEGALGKRGEGEMFYAIQRPI